MPTPIPVPAEPSGDVKIKYKGHTLAAMTESGTKILRVKERACEDDIEVEYTKPSAPTPQAISIPIYGWVNGSLNAPILMGTISDYAGELVTATYDPPPTAAIVRRTIWNNSTNPSFEGSSIPVIAGITFEEKVRIQVFMPNEIPSGYDSFLVIFETAA